jgi:hypothetical protein
MTKLEAPYWMARDALPGLDFNRQIVEPGTNETFPDGAIGVYVDDDFYCVAALPYEAYREVGIETIVAEFWPGYVTEATYAPDSGTIEQRLHFLEIEAAANKKRAEEAEEALSALRSDHERLKAGRTDLTPRNRTRMEHLSGYFIEQYEHLLTATAHEHEPLADKPGICSACGLYGSDRVHQQQWIDKRAQGHAPDMRFHGDLGTER